MSMLDQGSKLIALFLDVVKNYNVYVAVTVFAFCTMEINRGWRCVYGNGRGTRLYGVVMRTSTDAV